MSLKASLEAAIQSANDWARTAQLELVANATSRVDAVDFKLKSTNVQVIKILDALASFSTYDQVQAIAKQLDAVASTASVAQAHAEKGLRSMTSICFVKLAGKPCPEGASEQKLWHWYFPQSYDPWCSNPEGVERESADGRCQNDRAGHLLNWMLGCCT